MSAKNRGAVPNKFDDHPTPAWCVDRLLDRVHLPSGKWLEPCAGSGGIIKAVTARSHEPTVLGTLSHLRTVQWTAVELQSKYATALSALEHTHSFAGLNFLTQQDLLLGALPEWDVCLTNPPFTLAQAFVDACLLVCRHVVMLLRVNFLGSEERADWWEQQRVSLSGMPDIYVLPNRPTFTRNKHGKAATDATEYAWFHWHPDGTGTTSVLGVTPNEIRAAHRKSLPAVIVAP